MTRTPWTVVATVVALLAMVTPPGVASTVRTDRLVRVSGASPFEQGCGADMDGPDGPGREALAYGDQFADAEVEPSLAAHPARPETLVAAWMQDLYSGFVVGASQDGGKSWRTVSVPGITSCSGGDFELAADPWVSIGPDGKVYLAGFSLDVVGPVPVPVRTKLQVSTSDNGGRTWSGPRVVSAGAGLVHDKPAVTADPFEAGAAYLVWTDEVTPGLSPGSHLVFSRTIDGGTTWSDPRPIYLADELPFFSEILVSPTGELFAVFVESHNRTSAVNGPHEIKVLRSGDGGETWSEPTTAATFPASGQSSAPFRDPERGDKIQAPEIAISAELGPDGALYITWRNALPNSKAEIRFTKSTDGARTWTTAGAVSPGTAQAFLPNLAITRDGTVGIAYYDTRSDVLGDEGYTTEFWLTSSSDGGRTWSETSIGTFDLRRAPYRRIPVEGRFLGDYEGLVGLRHGFGVAFAATAPLAAIGATDILFTRLTPTGADRPR